jgi:hypothetical protein
VPESFTIRQRLRASSHGSEPSTGSSGVQRLDRGYSPGFASWYASIGEAI